VTIFTLAFSKKYTFGLLLYHFCPFLFMHVLFNDGRIILKLIIRMCMGWINLAQDRDSAGLLL
jgi:hypothetical protein